MLFIINIFDITILLINDIKLKINFKSYIFFTYIIFPFKFFLLFKILFRI